MRIIQVLTNLADNAVRNADDDRITIDVKADTNNLLVSVADTGTGIDPEIFPRLFEKFASKSGMDRFQTGSGLGLYVSKKIVESHGGKFGPRITAVKEVQLFISFPSWSIEPSKH